MNELIIETYATTCPDVLRFSCNKVWLAGGSIVVDNPQQAAGAPLITELFRLKQVRSVAICEDCITLTKCTRVSWDMLKPEVLIIIATHFHKPLFTVETADLDTSSEFAQVVWRLIDTKVRPFVQNDNGEIQFLGCDDDAVHLSVSGMCCGCAVQNSLKQNITRLLKYYTCRTLRIILHQ